MGYNTLYGFLVAKAPQSRPDYLDDDRLDLARLPKYAEDLAKWFRQIENAVDPRVWQTLLKDFPQLAELVAADDTPWAEFLARHGYVPDRYGDQLPDFAKTFITFEFRIPWLASYLDSLRKEMSFVHRFTHKAELRRLKLEAWSQSPDSTEFVVRTYSELHAPAVEIYETATELTSGLQKLSGVVIKKLPPPPADWTQHRQPRESPLHSPTAASATRGLLPGLTFPDPTNPLPSTIGADFLGLRFECESTTQGGETRTVDGPWFVCARNLAENQTQQNEAERGGYAGKKVDPDKSHRFPMSLTPAIGHLVTEPSFFADRLAALASGTKAGEGSPLGVGH